MAWRLHDQVVRGEIDNRRRGRVTGRIWLVDRPDPLELNLAGNALRDLAGCLLELRNPAPVAGTVSALASRQTGSVGDMTASLKVRVPEVSIGEMLRLSSAGLDYPWHWSNAVYLEWFSEINGRVVIESAGYELIVSDEKTWSPSQDEDAQQQRANRRTLVEFLRRCGCASDYRNTMDDADTDLIGEDDEPRSPLEAAADAEDAREIILLDRISARLDREPADEEHFERILAEEHARMRRERGEPEPPPPTPEEEEERRAWIEEMNRLAEQALQEYEMSGHSEPIDHPLVLRCRDLALELHRLTEDFEEDEPLHREHPLCEMRDGVMIASGKLAGALNRFADEEDEWPPNRLFAGHTLVRLKKARGHLRDALLGLSASAEQDLLNPSLRARFRAEINVLLHHVGELITELRSVLQDTEEQE